MASVPEASPERKPKSERRQRSAMVSVRFSPEEIAAVEARATEAGVPVSGFIRDLAIEPAKTAPPRTEMTSFRLPADMIFALRKLAEDGGESMSDLLRRGALMVLGICPTCGQPAPREDGERA